MVRCASGVAGDPCEGVRGPLGRPLAGRDGGEGDGVVGEELLPDAGVPLGCAGSHEASPVFLEVPLAWEPLALPCVLEGDVEGLSAFLEGEDLEEGTVQGDGGELREGLRLRVPYCESRVLARINTDVEH